MRSGCGLWWLLGALLHAASAGAEAEGRSGTIRELREALAELAGEGRTYLGRLAGEQTLLSVQKAFAQVLGVVADGLAGGLNVLLQYVSHFLQAAGVPAVSPPSTVTSDGLIFVAQWVLVVFIGYWFSSLAFRLVASTVRSALWLLKVGMALVSFGLILRDHNVGTETMAVRMAILVCVCILLGVGSSGGSNAVDKTARLEQQLKVLERRLREMEGWRRMEE